MPVDAGGNATRPPSPIPVSGQTADAPQVNVPINDIYSILNMLLFLDGRKPLRGNIQMNGHRSRGAGDAEQPQDYVTLGQIPALLAAQAVLYTTQTITPEQQAQARGNIGLGNSATRNVGTTAGTVAAGDDARLIDDPLSFAAQSLTSPQQAQVHTNLDTAAEVGRLALGVGQTWQDVSGSRAADTSYQNTTGKPIMVAINFGSTGGRSLQVSADNSTWVTTGQSAGAAQLNIYAVVPPNHYYKTVGAFSSFWSELR